MQKKKQKSNKSHKSQEALEKNRTLHSNMFPATPWFAHTQTTPPNNMIYLSPEDE
jgi:hypothetical protein